MNGFDFIHEIGFLAAKSFFNDGVLKVPPWQLIALVLRDIFDGMKVLAFLDNKHGHGLLAPCELSQNVSPTAHGNAGSGKWHTTENKR